jgi:hypothetical protein
VQDANPLGSRPTHLASGVVRSLTIVATYLTGGELNLSTSRLASPSWTRPIGINPCDTEDQECEIDRWTQILRMMDPVRVRLSGLPPGHFNTGAIPRIDIFSSAWPRLESLTVSNIEFDGFLGDSLLIEEGGGAGLIVTLDLSETVGDDAYEDRLRFVTSFELHPEAFPGPLDRIKSIVVMCMDETQKELFERDMLSLWSRKSKETTEAFTSHVRFETVPASSAVAMTG